MGGGVTNFFSRVCTPHLKIRGATPVCLHYYRQVDHNSHTALRSYQQSSVTYEADATACFSNELTGSQPKRDCTLVLFRTRYDNDLVSRQQWLISNRNSRWLTVTFWCKISINHSWHSLQSISVLSHFFIELIDWPKQCHVSRHYHCLFIQLSRMFPQLSQHALPFQSQEIRGQIVLNETVKARTVITHWQLLSLIANVQVYREFKLSRYKVHSQVNAKTANS